MAYSDLNGMMDLIEGLLESVAMEVCGTTEIEYQEGNYDIRSFFDTAKNGICIFRNFRKCIISTDCKMCIRDSLNRLTMEPNTQITCFFKKFSQVTELYIIT